MYETLDRLKHLPQNIVSEEFLIPEVLKLDITEEDMEREHRKQLRRRQLQQEQRSLGGGRGGGETELQT